MFAQTISTASTESFGCVLSLCDILIADRRMEDWMNGVFRTKYQNSQITTRDDDTCLKSVFLKCVSEHSFSLFARPHIEMVSVSAANAAVAASMFGLCENHGSAYIYKLMTTVPLLLVCCCSFFTSLLHICCTSQFVSVF